VERGVEIPHLVITVTLEGQVVLRSNDGSDALRTFEDLINFAVHYLAVTSSAFHSLPTIPIRLQTQGNGPQLGVSGRSRLLVVSSSQD
jgi:hypothetical protein